MRIFVNGDQHDLEPRTLALGSEQLGYGGKKIATAVNGRFVAAAGASRDRPRRRRSDRGRGAHAGRLSHALLWHRAFRRACCSARRAIHPPKILAGAVEASKAEVVTVSLRREAGTERGGQNFWSFIRGLGVRVLPNTAGCHTVTEAVTTAHMARELFGTPWIKLEVIRDDETPAARCVRPGRGGAHPRRRRLRGPFLTRRKISPLPTGWSRRGAAC